MTDGRGNVRRPETVRRVLALTSVLLANIMAVVDYNIVSVAIPELMRSFPGSTLAGLSWTITGYTVVFAAALLPAGSLADHLGTKRMFLGGLLVFTAGSLACALASGPVTLVLARMLQAVGGGAVVALAISVGLGELPDQRSRVFGLLGIAGGIAGAGGPSLGSALMTLGGWRWIFLINLPLGLLAATLGALGVRGDPGDEPAGTRPVERRLPDLPGSVLLAGGIGLLVLGLVQAPDWGWTSGGTVGALVAGAVITAFMVVRSLRHPRPAVDFTLLRVGVTAAGNAATVVFSVTLFAVVLCAALYMTDRLGFSTTTAGLGLTPGPVTAAISSWLSGGLVRRAGARRIAIAGCVVGAVGWSWPALLGRDDYLVGLLPALVLGNAGLSAISVALGTLASSALPPERFGTGSALIMLSHAVGAAVGIAGLTVVLHEPSAGAFRLAWLGLSGCLLATALIVMAVPRRDAGRPQPCPEPRAPSVRSP